MGPHFLLSQLGHHASHAFAQRLQPLGLTPQHGGVLRVLATVEPALTQSSLGSYLGVLPSRLVVLLDKLEASGLVERYPNPSDRRSNHLRLTKKGRGSFAKVERVNGTLDTELVGSLNEAEREQLVALLVRLTQHHGLLRGDRPAYRHLPDRES